MRTSQVLPPHCCYASECTFYQNAIGFHAMPDACSRRMGEWDQRGSCRFRLCADDLHEWEFTIVKDIDREAAHRDDQLRLDEFQLTVEEAPAKHAFFAGGYPIATADFRFSRITLGHRGHVVVGAKFVFFNSSFGQPFKETFPGGGVEGTQGFHLCHTGACPISIIRPFTRPEKIAGRSM